MKRNQEARRKWKRQHLKQNNQKPYNKCLINLVCSLSTGKYLLSVFSHRPRSFVARSVRKPQENTFPYRPRTRLIISEHRSLRALLSTMGQHCFTSITSSHFKVSVHMSPTNWGNHLSEIHASLLFCVHEKTFQVHMHEPARWGEIPPWAMWNFSEMEWKF